MFCFSPLNISFSSVTEKLVLLNVCDMIISNFYKAKTKNTTVKNDPYNVLYCLWENTEALYSTPNMSVHFNKDKNFIYILLIVIKFKI